VVGVSASSDPPDVLAVPGERARSGANTPGANSSAAGSVVTRGSTTQRRMAGRAACAVSVIRAPLPPEADLDDKFHTTDAIYVCILSNEHPSLAARRGVGVKAEVRVGHVVADPAHRLEATADHPTGRLPDPLLGYGMVDPVAAVTTALPEESGETAPKPQTRPVGIVLPQPENRRPEHIALITSAAITGCAALGGLLVATVRRGRRHWRSADET
jgi:hypothetical protein